MDLTIKIDSFQRDGVTTLRARWQQDGKTKEAIKPTVDGFRDWETLPSFLMELGLAMYQISEDEPTHR